MNEDREQPWSRIYVVGQAWSRINVLGQTWSRINEAGQPWSRIKEVGQRVVSYLCSRLSMVSYQRSRSTCSLVST